MSSAVTPVAPAANAPGIPGAAPALPRTPNYTLHVTLLLGALAVVTVAALLQTHGEERVEVPFLGVPLPPMCQFRLWTGMNCPGCGLTRAFIHLAHGDFAGAWYLNPAAFFLFPLVAVQIPYRAWQILRLRRGLPEFQDPRLLALMWIAGGAVFLQWLVRLVAVLLP